MKDVYFNDYNKKRNKKYDTAEIPLTMTEREKQERIRQERYEQIVRNQRQNEAARRARNQQSNQYDYAYDDVHTQQGYYTDEPVRRQQPSPAPKQKKKKGCGCSTLFICFVLIAALLSGGTFGYILSLCGKVNYIPRDESFSYSFLQSDPKIKNILLIGTDASDGEASRSDTIMLVSLDKNTQTIKFTSFMRDMWVDIPDHGESKINAAFAYGGAPLLIETIENNFKIKIDNYVLVDFDMFQQLIDGIGGVTVEITEAEADFINRTTHAKVSPGQNTLNGDYALIYCRIRKLDSDFMRTKRQRKVMTAIVEKIKAQSIGDTIAAGTNILPLITTDISPMKLTLMLFGAVSLLSYDNDQLRIPADGMYKSKTINGQAALVPDIDKNTDEIKEFIYQ